MLLDRWAALAGDVVGAGAVDEGRKRLVGVVVGHLGGVNLEAGKEGSVEEGAYGLGAVLVGALWFGEQVEGGVEYLAAVVELLFGAFEGVFDLGAFSASVVDLGA